MSRKKTPKNRVWLMVAIIALIIMAIIGLILILNKPANPVAEISTSPEVIELYEDANKMDDTPLGKEDEVSGADWYKVSDSNKTITATFPSAGQGNNWHCTVQDEEAITLEEEIDDISTWSAVITATGEKDTESNVYFDKRKEGSEEPLCVYILKIRTEGKTLRVIGIEENEELK